MNRALRAIAWCGLATAAFGARTTTWELNSYKDFAPGRFSGVSLNRDGELMLAPNVETIFTSDQPIIWSLAQSPDGAIYASTGHRGRVYKIDAAGKGSLLWTAGEPEVFVLTVDPKGSLYAASSPKGRVYRLEPGGKAVEYFDPKATYVWSMVFDRNGVLYVGTGEEGKIYRVETQGKGEVYYETGQSHITSLAMDAEGRLLAGTEPNGILYRITAKDKAFVLYDSSLPEIRSIVPTPGGIYVAALGGSMARRLQSVPAASQAGQAGAAASVSVSTSVSVAEDTQSGIDIKPKPNAAKPAAAPAASAAVQTSPVVDISGVEKSALYRILPDNTVDTLWSSKEENLYDFLPLGDRILFSTDEQGRVYRLSADRKVALLVQTNEGEMTRLIQSPKGLLAATGNLGKVLKFADQTGDSGYYESPVHDAGTVARWGRLRWQGEACQSCRLSYRTRSGNSARPDKTWSDWSGPLAGEGSVAVPSPNARFIQWRAEFTGGGGKSPVLDSVTLAYLPQNSPPSVNSITVTSQASAKPSGQSVAVGATAAYSVTVTDTGDTGTMSSGTPTQKLTRSASDEIRITWQAEDPDGDHLTYSVYFRSEDEKDWMLLKDRLIENTLAVDSDSLADGKYLFRVVASDSADNAPELSRTAELVGSPVLIDHTPPVVTAGAPRKQGSQVDVEVQAVDAASSLLRGEFSLDAGPWVPLQARDGVIDSPSEQFLVHLENLSPGEHLLVVRIHDSAENAGLVRVLLK